MCEQRRLWRIRAFAQARVSFRCSTIRCVPKYSVLAHLFPDRCCFKIIDLNARIGRLSFAVYVETPVRALVHVLVKLSYSLKQFRQASWANFLLQFVHVSSLYLQYSMFLCSMRRSSKIFRGVQLFPTKSTFLFLVDGGDRYHTPL